MTTVTLHMGDCLDVMAGMKRNSVDVVITDPPYGLGFEYLSYDDTRDNLKRLVDSFMPEALRIAPMVCVLPGITQVFLYPEPDWIFSVHWNTTGTFGKFGYSQWMPLLVYGKDLDGFGNVNGVTKTDVITINGGGGVGFMRDGEKDHHPCPKPENVMRKIVTRLTLPNAVVLDPFMGVGTTGVSCVKTGRRFVGIEINGTYFNTAQARIAEAQLQPTFLYSTNGAEYKQPEIDYA